MDGGIGRDIDGSLVRLAMRRLSRHAEVGLHFASFFGKHQRQNHRRAEVFRDPREEARASAPSHMQASGRPLCAKNSSPALGVAIFDDGQLLEELLSIAIAFDRGERSIQVGGVAFVAIVLVPRRIGLRRIGESSSPAEAARSSSIRSA